MKQLTNFPYKRVLVLGLARSGAAAAKLLLKSGVTVRVNDLNTNDTDEIRTLTSLGAEFILGSHPLSVLDGIEIMVKNPGIPYDHPLVEEALERNIPIITEVELAGKLFTGPIIGITGSNGKTTTTTLIADMLTNSDQKNEVAGNIGTAATEIAQTVDESTKLILELSSFQLLGIETFQPHIAVLLNLYEAHLDYHKTFENYVEAKTNIFSQQTNRDFLVYNDDDELIKKEVKKANATLIPFSLTRSLVDGAWTDEEYIYYQNERIIKVSDIVLAGDHHLENILASICVAKLSKASNEAIYKTLTTFTGVKHRLQFVVNKKDRLFYNDSKATNILATQKALTAFSQPTILLAGGLDRGNDFEELIPYLTYVKEMVLFGETADKLASIAKQENIPAITVANVEEAAKEAYNCSQPGDVILLSPACASWDQYKTFEQRGDMFINAVHTLK